MVAKTLHAAGKPHVPPTVELQSDQRELRIQRIIESPRSLSTGPTPPLPVLRTPLGLWRLKGKLRNRRIKN